MMVLASSAFLLSDDAQSIKFVRNKTMDRERQKKAPIYEALEAFKKKRVVPFDVPGHKRGRGNPNLYSF